LRGHNDAGAFSLNETDCNDGVFKAACSTQEEILVSTEKEFDINLVLKNSCLRKLATCPRKLLYYLAAIRSQIDADKPRPVDIQLITDLRKTSF